MFLKSLTLKGFKSFADPTTLDLEPGVTVVVGPNGSGKSNVVDAVAWALGAQGPRVVRSTKMDDVIFAGTVKRPALGRAEVSIVIDNSRHELPLDFSEVTLTRTLFRSGESEYAINGAACRLLDVQELLSDSGVGRSQHVIIGQGQIDGILAARPEERRAVIEEAAGILKYRRRRERAVRRLESSEASLTRLQDLLREVRRQMRPLERQAASAQIHGALESELTAIRRFLAGLELRTLESTGAEAAELARTLEQRGAVLAATLEQVEQKLQVASDSLAREPDEDLTPQLTALDRLHERARGLLALIDERRRSSAAVLAALEAAGDVASLEESRQRVQLELEETERDAIGLAPQSEQLALAEASLIEAEVAHAERFSGLARPDREDLATRRAAAEAARATLAAARQDEQVARVRSAELAERLATASARREQVGARHVELAGTVEQMQITATAARTELEEAVVARRASEERLSTAVEAHNRARSREEALELALTEARERADLGRLGTLPGLLGTLRELVSVSAGHALALEAALLGSFDAAVLADSAALSGAIAKLAGHGGALLPVPDTHADVTPHSVPPGCRLLRSLVDARDDRVGRLLDEQLRDVFLTERSVAEAIDFLRADREIVLVTDAGDRIARTGIRLATSSVGATASAHSDVREVREAAAFKVQEVEEEAASLRATEQRAITTEAEQRFALDSAVAELASLGRELASVDVELQRLEGDVAAASTRETVLASELQPMVDVVERAERELAVLEVAASESASQYEAADAARHLLDERARALAALRRDLEVRAAGLEGQREQLIRRREELDSALVERREAVEEAAQRRRVFDAEEQAMLGLRTELTALVEELAQRSQVVGTERDRRHALGRTHLERLGSLRSERDAADHQLGELREQRQRNEITIAESRIRLEAALDALRRDLDIEPAEALTAPRPELAPGIEPAARARTLERELREIGPVNPLAAEELAALSERSAFLEGQLEDVRRARRELNQVIHAVDAEIVDVFAAAYEDVAANFEALFATLFPGGEGRLSLTAPDDLLESGVEIEARPAGRNVRRLSLLSGGERSLVAMAYLFAVFRSRPSPFYLLDEVEAALDEVNLTRFHDLVNEFRDEAQLIIVSHQKKTMEVADALYGISMQPGGASKVISERVTAPRRGRRTLETSGGWT